MAEIPTRSNPVLWTLAVQTQLLVSTRCQLARMKVRRMGVLIRPFSGRQADLDCERDGRLQPVPRKGKLHSCHVDGRSTTLTPGQTDDGKAAGVAPKFTDTTSSNLGLPKNPADPFYYETTPDGFGFTPNPAGFAFTDLGVGLFLRNFSGTTPNSDSTPLAPAFDGFMQMYTVRNADTRPKYPNGKTFPKAHMHKDI